MLCERCGFENQDGIVVCVQCYYAVGVPYATKGKGGGGGKKAAGGKLPGWAAEMGLTEFEVRQIKSQIGDALKGQVLAYWFNSKEDATETQKALADTIGKELQAKKVKVGIFNMQSRTLLFVAGTISDAETVKMVCESFNGQAALSAPMPGSK